MPQHASRPQHQWDILPFVSVGKFAYDLITWTWCVSGSKSSNWR